MEIIIRLLILLFFAFFGVSSEEGTAPPPEETFESPTYIEAVEAVVLESAPAQLQVHVVGAHTNGCDYPVQIEQQRSGNTVTVRIFREIPQTVMCPAVMRSYEETITLEGTFEPGMYTIDVNGFVIEVVI